LHEGLCFADAQTLAAYIGLLKVMRDYDLKRVSKTIRLLVN
jgi:hypothetical protein